MCYYTYIMCYDGRLTIIVKKYYLKNTQQSLSLAVVVAQIQILYDNYVSNRFLSYLSRSKSNRDRIYSFVPPKSLIITQILIKPHKNCDNEKKPSEINRIFSSLYRNRYTSRVTRDTYILCGLQRVYNMFSW